MSTKVNIISGKPEIIVKNIKLHNDQDSKDYCVNIVPDLSSNITFPKLLKDGDHLNINFSNDATGKEIKIFLEENASGADCKDLFPESDQDEQPQPWMIIKVE